MASKPAAIRRLFFNKEVKSASQTIAPSRLRKCNISFPQLLQWSPLGLYGIKFFADGQWQNITVDDRLPAKGPRLLLVWLCHSDVDRPSSLGYKSRIFLLSCHLLGVHACIVANEGEVAKLEFAHSKDPTELWVSLLEKGVRQVLQKSFHMHCIYVCMHVCIYLFWYMYILYMYMCIWRIRMPANNNPINMRNKPTN